MTESPTTPDRYEPGVPTATDDREPLGPPPTVGRQVYYISTINMDGEIVDPWAATVARVNQDGTVNLQAINPHTCMDFPLFSIRQATGTDPQGCSGRWMWPPRV